ncbi:M20 family metallopeptidase [Microbacterium sp. H1-D42]|uniref:M20 metallopeptidase family protein n=1 Tax=Microbacterium sp. H1-D42 TaxID=2925844 RepID=UPI001F53917D|nr:M20 family metallopeptidase [Microbacterium sp. H1-D42]UNK69949.1 M20 family metallopeptidase [Microbacterium sp. H1-D42]
MTAIVERLRSRAREISPDLIALRRRLHANPELALDLPRTQAEVLDALAPLDLEVTVGSELSSVTAVLRGGTDGPVVLLRADMDGLPLTEQTGLDYASENGAMHACGHDLHVAGLIGAARLLSEVRSEIAGTVIFMFQPGEERGAGAAGMIYEGVLDAAGKPIDAAYALHVGNDDLGVFRTRPGTILAGTSAVKVSVRGAGGHGSRPHQAVDPVPVVAELVLAAQSWVTRRVDIFDPVVLSVTKLYAGEVLNVIPDEAGFGATLRTLSAASLAQATRELPLLVDRIAAAHGCTATVEIVPGYPATVNDAQAVLDAQRALVPVFGEQRVLPLDTPRMAAEDFSYVLERVPGAYLLLGARPPHVAVQDVEPNHSPRALFDDDVLADQSLALAVLAFHHVGAA